MQSDTQNSPDATTEATPPSAEPPASFDPAARIAALEAENLDLIDRLKRAQAETLNIQARAKREVEDTRQYAVQKFATDVVEAAENLRRGLASLPTPEPGEPGIVGRLREGLEGIERNFLGILERNGIRREDPTGALFDPNLHQAISEQETAEHPPRTVVQAWTSGWTLNGRLLKPAMVVVSKAPPGGVPQPANESRPGESQRAAPGRPAAKFTA